MKKFFQRGLEALDFFGIIYYTIIFAKSQDLTENFFKKDSSLPHYYDQIKGKRGLLPFSSKALAFAYKVFRVVLVKNYLDLCAFGLRVAEAIYDSVFADAVNVVEGNVTRS